MKVNIKYNYSTCRIEHGVLSTNAQNALSDRLSYDVQGAEHMQRSSKFRHAEWDGKKRLYHKGHRTFGTGLLSTVIEVLTGHGYDVSVTDMPEYFMPSVSLPEPGQEWELRDYQDRAVAEAIAYERGMLKIATGGGKTVIAGHLISRLKTNTVFFVHTKDLLYQALTTFRSMFGEENVGQIGDGVIHTERPIIVCTLQTAARALGVGYEKDSYADGEDSWSDDTDDRWDGEIARMLNNAGCVILDECHRVAAPTATNVIGSVKNARYRYGLSASPWRDDGADMVLEAVFGEVLVDINASTLIDMGHLVKPIIRIKQVEPGRFPKGTKFNQIYEQYIVHNDNRNDAIIADARSKVRRGLPTLVLVKHINHGGYLAGMLDCPFLSGKDESSVRNAVINDMREGRCGLLVATTIADEGLDIKPLAGLVLAGGGKSSTRALQRVGRVLRPFPGKRFAEVTDFEDNARLLIDHSRARLKIYESESRFEVTDL